MSEPELNPLEVLAREAIYIDDLAGGFLGEFEITSGWGLPSDRVSPREALDEIRTCQVVLFAAGWRQAREEEYRVPVSHNYEVACYRKQLRPGQRSQWIVVTVASRFGFTAKFRAVKELSDL